MWRKSLLISAVVTIASAMLVVATPEIASAHPLAVGSVSCTTAQGSGKVTPPIVPVGSGTRVKITFTANFAGCTSSLTTPPGASVTGAFVKGTGYFTASSSANSCSNFDGTDTVGVIKVHIKWTTTGGLINPTTDVYTLEPSSVTGPTNGIDTIDLDSPYGSSSGSFASSVPPDTTSIVTTIPAPGSGCGGSGAPFGITGGVLNFG